MVHIFGRVKESAELLVVVDSRWFDGVQYGFNL